MADNAMTAVEKLATAVGEMVEALTKEQQENRRLKRHLALLERRVQESGNFPPELQVHW
jgi:hypothetical protein